MAQTEIDQSPCINTLHSTAWWLYLFHALCLVLTLGTLSFIPLICNYLARPKAINTYIYTHETWQIRSFWWYFIWVSAGWICYATIIGILLAKAIWAIIWIWYAYRLIKGFLYLNNEQAMPYPES